MSVGGLALHSRACAPQALLYSAAKQADKFNLPLNGWNVATVTDMTVRLPPAPRGAGIRRGGGGARAPHCVPAFSQNMFFGAAVFDQDLSAWDVGSATSLKQMFRGTSDTVTNVYNQSLNAWNVAKVTDMEGVFADTKYFSKEIGSWNTAKVITMKDMFKGATAFAQNLNDWDVGKVATMNQMFMGATMFNAPVNAWNVAKVEDTISMFNGATLFNQDLGAWDVGTNNFANVAGVAADYGIVKLAPAGGHTGGNPATNSKFLDMFTGTTSMSDCNKKAIQNKFVAAPRSLGVVFDPAITPTAGWSYPNLVCP